MLMHPTGDATPVVLLGESSISGDYESRRVHSAGRRLCGRGKHKMRGKFSALCTITCKYPLKANNSKP